MTYGKHSVFNENPILYAHNVDELLQTGLVRVCVVGIGRIGLPTALSFARAGFRVIGLDINESLVSDIRSGKFPLKDEPGYRDIFESVRNTNKFTVTTDPSEAIPNSDVIILSLPTPMDNARVPEYTALQSVASQLNALLADGSIVVVESTVEPNFVESEIAPLIEGDRSRLRISENFGLGVCPETANPGEILNNFESLPRLVSAIDERTAEIISTVYKHVFSVEIIKMPDCRTANAVKLTTNVFRDLNVAFVNELAVLFEHLGIDIHTVLSAAKRKYNFEPHYPSAGVGGPCLPVNSYQMINTASQLTGDDSLLRLVRAGRRVNESMPDHSVKLLYAGLQEAGVAKDAPSTTIMGISYKPNIRDVQLAPSERIIQILRSKGMRLQAFDPYYAGDTIFGIHVAESAAEAMQGCDAVMLVTAHGKLASLDPSIMYESGCRVVVDCVGMLDPKKVIAAKLVYMGIGRGITR